MSVLEEKSVAFIYPSIAELNFAALAAGLDVTQALAVESAEGDAAQLYANIVAVRRGCEENEKTKVLLAALTTQRVYDYIQTTYNGAVLPVFTV